MEVLQFKRLIDRYLAGKATAIEIAAIDKWLDQVEEHAEVIPAQDRIRLQTEMLTQIRLARPTPLPAKNTNILSLFKPYLQIAAILGMVSGLWLLSSKFYQANHPVLTANPVVAYESYTTPKGRKATLILADQTVIQLNSATTIRYPKQFAGSQREVFLDEGEAFFKVTPDAKHAFVIHSPHDIDTKVLGTSFNIKNYKAIGELALSVNTGKVQVNNGKKAQQKVLGTFTSGQGLTFHIKNQEAIYTHVDAAAAAAWKDNVLILKDADYKELKHTLENWFAIEITLKMPKDPSQLFTGKFENPSLQEVLRSLQKINQFNYQLKGNQLSISN